MVIIQLVKNIDKLVIRVVVYNFFLYSPYNQLLALIQRKNANELTHLQMH